MRRVDVWVSEKFHVGRSMAKDLIKSGLVRDQDGIIKRASKIHSGENLELLTSLDVGRGARKLRTVKDWIPSKSVAADVGASTGGFTQVLLEEGYERVYALDVGHGQLNEGLKNDPRVINREGLNVRHPFEMEEKVDFVVMDLSFISLRLVLPNLKKHLSPGATIVALFKPQFEGSLKTCAKGVVSEKNRHHLRDEFVQWVGQSWKILAMRNSEVEGKKGNLETFVHLLPLHS